MEIESSKQMSLEALLLKGEGGQLYLHLCV